MTQGDSEASANLKASVEILHSGSSKRRQRAAISKCWLNAPGGACACISARMLRRA